MSGGDSPLTVVASLPAAESVITSRQQSQSSAESHTTPSSPSDSGLVIEESPVLDTNERIMAVTEANTVEKSLRFYYAGPGNHSNQNPMAEECTTINGVAAKDIVSATGDAVVQLKDCISTASAARQSDQQQSHLHSFIAQIEPLIVELVIADLIWDAIQLARTQVIASGKTSNQAGDDRTTDRNLTSNGNSNDQIAIASWNTETTANRRQKAEITPIKTSAAEILQAVDASDIKICMRRHSISTISQKQKRGGIDGSSGITEEDTIAADVANINRKRQSATFHDSTINHSLRSSDSTSSADYSIASSPLNLAGRKSPVLHSPTASTTAARMSPVSDGLFSTDEDGRRSRKEGVKVSGNRKPFIGTKISEGHVNYVLMYDMLTGIRIAVSRCVAKPHRELSLSDFRARHKLTFDIMGNELTPSSRYDFKFKDYAPWVFRSIREHFKIEAADYLVSLTGKYVLSELGSSGKSGSFFYFSQDYRFIIKTIHHTEHKVLFRMLPKYYEHIKNNQNTLLTRYLGLHRVKLPRGKKIHFVVMGNVFPPNKDIHETFDLKGSLVGREVSEQEIQDNPRVVMKDINWLKFNRKLIFGPVKRKTLAEQLEKDVKFLMEMELMDYSLLTGLHYLQIGNSANIRDKSLSVFEPNAERLAKQPVSSRKANMVSEMRRVIAESETVELGTSSNKLPSQTPNERRGCLFYKDDGGFRSTDQNNLPLSELYFIGIIDILTPYNYIKKIEHTWKSLRSDKRLISAVQPKEYGHRFLEFLFTKVLSLAEHINAETILPEKST